MARIFDNYDPNANNYDPSNADGPAPSLDSPAKVDGLTVMQGGNLAQFDISINNATAVAYKMQLFNYIFSVSNVAQAGLVGNFPPFTGADVAAANPNSLTYWGHDGELITRNAVPANVTIQCKQLPYRSLLESSSRTPFQIEKMRLTVTNDAQIDNEIFVVYNSWLGEVKRNSVNPRTYFNPNQFQSKIIDIPLKTIIDFERGLEVIVNAGEVINLSFFVSAYRKYSLNR